MSYFKECPHCGSHLDPNEKCNCEESNVNNIIDISPVFDLDKIILKKGELFLKTVKEVSEYLNTLPITTEQNDKLVALMIAHTSEARVDAYKQGFQMGQDFQEYCNLFHGGNENDCTKR